VWLAVGGFDCSYDDHNEVQDKQGDQQGNPNDYKAQDEITCHKRINGHGYLEVQSLFALLIDQRVLISFYQPGD
jgi:hypothetical protein